MKQGIDMKLHKKLFLLALMTTVLFVCGCGKSNSQDMDLSSNTEGDEQLKQVCIETAVCGIKQEIKRHQQWIEGKVGKEQEQFKQHLSELKGDLEKFQNLKLEDYEIPQKLEVTAWVNSPASENSILYFEGLTRSGPWYHICGIKGDDYSVLEPDTQYLITIYLVYPRYYWHMDSWYVYINEYKE